MFPHPVTVSSETATVHCTCLLCGINVDLDLDLDNYISWQTGSLIQTVFPDLTSDQRELLISSICGPCFDEFED